MSNRFKLWAVMLSLLTMATVAGCGSNNNNGGTTTSSFGGSTNSGAGGSNTVSVDIRDSNFGLNVVNFQASVFSITGVLLGTASSARVTGGDTVITVGTFANGQVVVQIIALDQNNADVSYYQALVTIPVATVVVDSSLFINGSPPPPASIVPSPGASPGSTPSASPGSSPIVVVSPGASPNASPGSTPSASPRSSPSATPGSSPSASPGSSPSASPGSSPSASPGSSPSASPGSSPSASPGSSPSSSPAASPSGTPVNPGPSPQPGASPGAAPGPLGKLYILGNTQFQRYPMGLSINNNTAAQSEAVINSSQITAGVSMKLDTLNDRLYIANNPGSTNSTPNVLVYEGASQLASGNLTPNRIFTAATLTSITGMSVDLSRNLCYLTDAGGSVQVIPNASTANGLVNATLVNSTGFPTSLFSCFCDSTNNRLYVSGVNASSQGDLGFVAVLDNANTLRGAVTVPRTVSGLQDANDVNLDDAGRLIVSNAATLNTTQNNFAVAIPNAATANGNVTPALQINVTGSGLARNMAYDQANDTLYLCGAVRIRIFGGAFSTLTGTSSANPNRLVAGGNVTQSNGVAIDPTR